jgi:hypothetical protein
MSGRDWAVLGFKLTGLWIVANAVIGIAGLPYLWVSGFEEVRAFTVLWGLLPALVGFGVGMPVFLSAEWFAARVFPGDQNVTQKPPASPEGLFGVALSIMGVFFICSAIPALVNAVSLVFFTYRASVGVLGVDEGTRRGLWDATGKAQLASAMAQFLVGLLLVLGPRRLSTAFVKIRGGFESKLLDEEPLPQGASCEEADASSNKGMNQTKRRR